MADRDLITFGPVHLEVRNIETTVRFWESLFGFTRRTSGDSVEMGTEKETLIVLHGGATLPVGGGHSGLYHLAIHVPDQRDFARLLKRFSDLRYPCSPTDHTFSKAIYLEDPDGINIGVTSRNTGTLPRRQARRKPTGVYRHRRRRASGFVPSRSRPHIPVVRARFGTRASPPSDEDWPHPPLCRGPQTVARLLHRARLRACKMVAADAGRRLRCRRCLQAPHRHQHLAGIDAPPHPPGMARMRHFELRFETMEGLDAAIRANPSTKPLGTAHVLHDPSGIELRLVRV